MKILGFLQITTTDGKAENWISIWF
jgi:hypothetical protein